MSIMLSNHAVYLQILIVNALVLADPGLSATSKLRSDIHDYSWI